MPYSKLLNQLASQTYIQLKGSPVHGIGVFAILLIPKGCRNIFSKGLGEWIKVPIKEVEALPEYGFKMIDPIIFLNHSSKPNIISINDGEEFEAIDDILPGQELLINYGDIVEGMDGYE